MDVNRLFKYGDLLAKGASEAQRIISENYDAKSKIIENIKSGSEIQPKFGQRAEVFELIKKSRVELIELIEKDKEIFKRVKRWVKSKESNTALNMLEEGMMIKLPFDLSKDLSKIIEFNKRDYKILMKLGTILDDQEKLVKEDKILIKRDKLDPAKFVKMFEKSLKKQHNYSEELNYYGTESSKIFNNLLENAKKYMSWMGDITIGFGGIGMWEFLKKGDESGLEIILGNVLLFASSYVLYKLLMAFAANPKFTKQIRTFALKYQ